MSSHATVMAATSPVARRASPAFTLVELLVTTAILAILVAILLPSLARARKQAYQVKCAANLKSLGLSVFYYVEDQKNGNGYLPLFGCETELYTGAYWANQILPYIKVRRTPVGRRDGLFVCPADDDFKYIWINGRDGRGKNAGSLASEMDKRRVDALGASQSGPRVLVEPVSYVGTSELLITGQPWPGVKGERTPRRLVTLERPYCQVLLTEASHRAAYCFHWEDIVREPFDGNARFQRNYRRHYGGASAYTNGMNWLFADGHAQWYSVQGAADRLLCCADFGHGQWSNLRGAREIQSERCRAVSSSRTDAPRRRLP